MKLSLPFLFVLFTFNTATATIHEIGEKWDAVDALSLPMNCPDPGSLTILQGDSAVQVSFTSNQADLDYELVITQNPQDVWNIQLQSSTWGDAVTWSLTNNTGAVLMSGGPFGNGYSVSYNVEVAPEDLPLAFYINTDLNDNFVEFQISCNGEILAGSIGGNETFFADNLMCNSTDSDTQYFTGTTQLGDNVVEVNNLNPSTPYSACVTFYCSITESSQTICENFFNSSEPNNDDLTGCIAFNQWISGVIPSDGSMLAWTTCIMTGEFSTVTILESGTYWFNSNYAADFITVTDLQNNIIQDGSIVPHIIDLDAGQYRIHFHANAQCGISAICRTGTAMRLPLDEAFASGKVFVDFNCDSLFSQNDVVIPNALIYSDGIPISSTNVGGNYFVLLPSQPVLNLSVNSISGFAINDFQLSTDPPQQYFGVDFGYCPVETTYDLSVSISPFGPPPRPGYNSHYKISVNNFGTSQTDASIELDFSNMANVSVSNAANGTVVGSTITWAMSNVSIFLQQDIYMSFLVPIGTSIGTNLNPSVNISIIPDTLIEVSYANNVASYAHLVVAAFDPNDKTVDYPIVNYTEIPEGEGAELEYLIRFQNTGNAAATFVRVVDELPDLLDISTIHMINASHDYELSFPEPNVLEWFFDEIMLPDSTTDEPGSHGFIHFRIKTLPSVQLDDVIENNASIYFDFKQPVITEYAVTAFMDCSDGSLEIIIPQTVCAGEQFVLSPNRNDFTDYQWIVDGEPISGVEISAMLNENSVVQLFANHPVCSLSTSLDVTVTQQPSMTLILGSYVSCTGPLEIETFCSADFTWYLNENNQGVDDPFIASESGLYNVICENDCGAHNTNIVVEIYDTSAAEILLDDNGQLTANPPGQSYIWYLNGEPILDSNNQNYTPTESGEYSVTIVFGSGCGSTADAMFVTVSIGEELASKVIIYPNPANQFVNVLLPYNQWKMAIIDITGKVVIETGEVKSDNINIDTKQLASGVYLLKGTSPTESFTKTIIVQ